MNGFLSPEARRKTRLISAGPLVIGGCRPISVQTMWKEPLSAQNRQDIVERIRQLKRIGCELIRFSVPDSEIAEQLGALIPLVDLPVVADIHYDYRLALRCMDFPIAKIRINPGNIGEDWKVAEIVRKAKERNVALRIGVNSGSLTRQLKGEKHRAAAMVKAAEKELELFGALGFDQVVVSLKSSDIRTMVEANLLFAEKYDFPLHLGVTEAGPLIPGIVNSALALSVLLLKGIGDTLRVSLTDSPEAEIRAGKAILRSLGLGPGGISLVSCPTCGRKAFDVARFIEQIYPTLEVSEKNASIAIMGCPVNGPGEARAADLGITGSGKHVLIFKKGKIIRRAKPDEALQAFVEEFGRL